MIDVVIVGAGAVVEVFYRAPLKKLEKAGALRVAAVADVDEARANRTAGQFRNARSFTELEHALSGMAFDLAIIASPPALHAQHSIIAFEHGCHVLCEKPMSTTPADAAQMNHASAQIKASGSPFRGASGRISPTPQDRLQTANSGKACGLPIARARPH